MSEDAKHDERIDQEASAESQLIDFLLNMLEKSQIPDASSLSESIVSAPNFQKLVSYISALREMSASLAQGDLDKQVNARGYTIANLKSLQSNLRHLSWQIKRIASGDFTQKVDFLGEFSVAFNQMTTKLDEMTALLLDSAHMDPLTGVANRQGLKSFASAIFSDKKNQFCVLMIDIDHFKNFNDTYGHDVGDEVLVEVAKRMQAQLRKADHFCRYGGEEFIAILSKAPLDVAKNACQRILHYISQTPIHTKSGLDITVTVSIGLSERSPDDPDFDAIVKRSDLALYDAKNSGRNRYCIRDQGGEPMAV